jgi:hypothetical protein
MINSPSLLHRGLAVGRNGKKPVHWSARMISQTDVSGQDVMRSKATAHHDFQRQAEFLDLNARMDVAATSEPFGAHLGDVGADKTYSTTHDTLPRIRKQASLPLSLSSAVPVRICSPVSNRSPAWGTLGPSRVSSDSSI